MPQMNIDFLLELAEKAAMLKVLERLVKNLDEYDVKRVMLALFKDDDDESVASA